MATVTARTAIPKQHRHMTLCFTTTSLGDNNSVLISFVSQELPVDNFSLKKT